MNDDFQTIVEIVILLIFVGMMFVPFLLFFIYLFYQNAKRKKIRERTRQAFAKLIGNNSTVPVRYCSEPHFKSWLDFSVGGFRTSRARGRSRHLSARN